MKSPSTFAPLFCIQVFALCTKTKPLDVPDPHYETTPSHLRLFRLSTFSI